MKSTPVQPLSLLPDAERVARAAGGIIMTYYKSGAETIIKADGSPVTAADHAAEEYILAELKKLTPHIPILSEEAAERGEIPDISGGTFWTVDPLDGTREFISRTGAFVVALSLIVDHKPLLGVVYHPALGLMYTGAGPGTAVKELADGTRIPLGAALQTPAATDENIRVVLNDSSADMPKVRGYLSRQFGAAAAIDAKSGVLRPCQVAEDTADISLVWPKRRNGRTKFWDVAPGHAIVEAAGGCLQQMDGKPVVYDSADLQVPPHIAVSPRHLSRRGAVPPVP